MNCNVLMILLRYLNDWLSFVFRCSSPEISTFVLTRIVAMPDNFGLCSRRMDYKFTTLVQTTIVTGMSLILLMTFLCLRHWPMMASDLPTTSGVASLRRLGARLSPFPFPSLPFPSPFPFLLFPFPFLFP